MSTDDDRAADDRTAELLARALSEHAAMVDPDPGALQAIQRRTAAAPARARRAVRQPWLLGALGAGLATAAVVTAIVLVVNNGGDSTPSAAPANQQSTGPTSQQNTGGSVQQVHPHRGFYDPTAPAADQVTVYYPGPVPDPSAGDPTQTVRLYAETHTLTDPGDDPRLAALNELLSSTPIDADYTAWLPRDVYATGISDVGPVTTVDLAGAPSLLSIGALPHPSPMGFSQNEGVAIQGLLKTIGADRPVSFTYNGKPIAMFELNDASPSISPAADDDVRAFVSIDNIVDGQTVTNPVTVLVSGNTFEGNVVWQLRDSNGTMVDNGYVTTAQGSWKQVTIHLGTLDPGTYTFRAFEGSGQDGSAINVDDKTFTVG